MITRKIARDCRNAWLEFSQNGNKDVEYEDWYETLPDTPTPDEMLQEMREWAECKDLYFYFYNKIYRKNKKFFGVKIMVKCYNPSTEIIDVCETSETIAITEAYRQWKEATNGDN